MCRKFAKSNREALRPSMNRSGATSPWMRASIVAGVYPVAPPDCRADSHESIRSLISPSSSSIVGSVLCNSTNGTGDVTRADHARDMDRDARISCAAISSSPSCGPSNRMISSLFTWAPFTSTWRSGVICHHSGGTRTASTICLRVPRSTAHSDTPAKIRSSTVHNMRCDGATRVSVRYSHGGLLTRSLPRSVTNGIRDSVPVMSARPLTIAGTRMASARETASASVSPMMS